MIKVAELKKHLNLTTTDDDTYLADLEASAVAFVQQITGRYFGPVASRTEYSDGNNLRSLWLSDFPVAGTVTIQRRASAIESAETVATGDYAVRGRELVMPAGWGSYEYEITYSVGYAPGAEPEDIRGAVRDLVLLAYRRRGGMRTEAIGGYSYTIANLDELGIAHVLEAHRAPVIA